MFTPSAHFHLGVPHFDTRRALIVINLQNDALSLSGELAVTKPAGFVDKIKTIVPHFRNLGDVVWVRTEFISDKLVDAQPSSNLVVGEDTRPEPVQQSDHGPDPNPDDAAMDEGSSPAAEPSTYYPSSRAKHSVRHASAKARAEQREAYHAALQNLEPTESLVAKPRSGQGPRYFQPGTHGAAIADDLLPLVDEAQDLAIIKSHYSAFDDTPLLLSLRMRLVTDLYLCGCLSNVSIYATAADAVKHGFSVTVVEDCIGYRSKANHETALSQMEDMMGAYGITSGELIAEMKGAASPDSEKSSFTSARAGAAGMELQSLSLGKEADLSINGASISSPADPSGKETTRVPTGLALPPGEATPCSESRHGVSSHGVTHRTSAILGAAGAAPVAPSLTSSRPEPTMPEKVEIASGSGPTVSRLSHGGIRLADSKMVKSSHRARQGSKLRMPLLGPNAVIGEGDSRIVLSVLPPCLNDSAFSLLRTEVQWKSMRHRSGEVPRLVAVQGDMDRDGSSPIYRHPADESPPLLPFSPLVDKIRVEVQKSLNQPMNHALVQLYRSGEDNISEHSDKVCMPRACATAARQVWTNGLKTLDIVRGSSIVNVSIGAQRVMTLRTKKSKQAHGTEASSATRKAQRIAMPTNSMFVLGPRTNMQWLHAVRADKRLPMQKSDEERAFGGERISITFRHIGTFMNEKDQTIWGQGARSKAKSEAAKVRRTDAAEMEAMVVAFGKENHQPDFDWDAEYGQGFNVTDLVSKTARLFLCRDHISNRRVQLSLIERGVPFEVVPRRSPSSSRPLSTSSLPHALENTQHPIFKDTDEDKSEVEGDLAILSHVEKVYPCVIPQSSATTARVFSRTTQSNDLLYLWRDVKSTTSSADAKDDSSRSSNSARPISPIPRIQEFKDDLKRWEDFAGEAEFIAGDHFTVIDCAFWPVLNEVVREWEEWNEGQYPGLAAYHQRLAQRESVTKVVDEAGSMT